jgi:predicted DNA-binding transcriptional regulator YafY
MIEDQVRQACEEQRVLRIVYRNPNKWGEVSSRDIDVYSFDGVYLDAYCRLRREKRTFRMDRIESADLLDQRFDQRPEIDEEIQRTGWSLTPIDWRRPEGQGERAVG